MKHFKILITTALLLLCSLVQGRQFVDRNFVSSLGQTIPYKVAFPEAFDPAESYPVLLFLAPAKGAPTTAVRLSTEANCCSTIPDCRM